jgi:hypothetical protein
MFGPITQPRMTRWVQQWARERHSQHCCYRPMLASQLLLIRQRGQACPHTATVSPVLHTLGDSTVSWSQQCLVLILTAGVCAVAISESIRGR